MGYLTDLAAILRDAGLTVIEEPGWRTRARKSGGFAPGRPTHAMIHHTASPPSSDGQRDVNYICYGSPDKPITNVYFNRAGTAWVCAAGATNTNGKGADTWGGGVPADRMNEYAIGIEIANTGTGEPYPMAQQVSVLTATAALCAHYGINTHNVRGHFEWAPTRKIDPSGPSMWAPSGGKWSMDLFRADVADRLHPPDLPAKPQPDPAPQPDPEGDDDMPKLIFAFTEYANTFNEHGVHLSPEAAQAMIAQGAVIVVSKQTHPKNWHLDSLMGMSGLTADYLVKK